MNNHIIKAHWLKVGAFFLAVTLQSCSSGNNGQTSQQAKRDTVSILQIADIHSQLEEHDEFFYENDTPTFRRRGGLDHLKSLADSVRAQNETIVVDGGDLIQGGGASVYSQGSIFPPLVNEMGYDITIPGNWGVVYGKDRMMDIMGQYEADVLAANIHHESNGERIFQPHTVKEVNGLKLGFIGYDDPDVPTRQNPAFSEGLQFTDLKSSLPDLITKLKEERGVDVLFLITHMGISKQVALGDDPMVEGVDYILGNDTHERIREPLDRNYAKVVEPGAFGSFAGRLDLISRGDSVVDTRYELMEVDPKQYPADQEMANLIDSLKAPYQDTLNRVLGYTKTPLYRYLLTETPMDNMITNAAHWKTGVDVALSNGFRFSTPLAPGEQDSLAITKEDLWSMLPVNNKVKVGRASGQQIRTWLEEELHNVFAEDRSERFGGWLVRFSGMNVKFNSSNPKGERILDITIAGEPLEAKRSYTLSACKRPGAPKDQLCRMPGIQDPKVLDYTMHDAVEQYLAHKGTVSPELEGRAKAVDLQRYALSQMPGADYEFR